MAANLEVDSMEIQMFHVKVVSLLKSDSSILLEPYNKLQPTPKTPRISAEGYHLAINNHTLPIFDYVLHLINIPSTKNSDTLLAMKHGNGKSTIYG